MAKLEEKTIDTTTIKNSGQIDRNFEAPDVSPAKPRRKLPRGWLIAIIAVGCILALLIGSFIVIAEPWVSAPAPYEPETHQGGSFELLIGDTIVLAQDAKLSNEIILYDSDNPSIATVDEAGLITAIAEGSAIVRITVMVPGELPSGFFPKLRARLRDLIGTEDYPSDELYTLYYTDYQVTVSMPDVDMVDVGAFDMYVGDTTQLTTTPTEEAPIVKVTGDNPETLSVTDAGELKALAEGTATVTVLYSRTAPDGANVPVRGERYTVNVLKPTGNGGGGGGGGTNPPPDPPKPPAPPVVTSVVFTTALPSSIQQGGSATVKAEARGNNNPSKAVTYMLDRAVDGVSIDASGKITVSDSAAVGSKFKVIATSVANTAISKTSAEVAIKAKVVWPPTEAEIKKLVADANAYAQSKGMGINTSLTIGNAGWSAPASTDPFYNSNMAELKNYVWTDINRIYDRLSASEWWYEGAPVIRVVYEKQSDGHWWIYTLYG